MPDDAEIHVQDGTLNFLMQGGVYRLGIAAMKKDGRIPKYPVFHEYPKMLRISQGMETFDRETETCRNTTVRWQETKEIFREIIVESEEEEDRVLSGGKTSAQLEDERQTLLTRCHNLGIPADPKWTAVRLRRELGDKLDQSEVTKPADQMAALERELSMLRKMSEMRAEIERLRASMEPARDERDDLRAELAALGIVVDGRWSASRLRDELERATAPTGRAA